MTCQLAHYAQLRDLVAPFKSFLSPRTRFQWSDDLEKRFIEAKKEIVAAIEKGVEIFEPRTACGTTWKGGTEWCFPPRRAAATCLSRTGQ